MIDIQDTLKALYLASNIVFGEDLEDVKQFVEIPEHKKTYALGIQLNDLLDKFLTQKELLLTAFRWLLVLAILYIFAFRRHAQVRHRTSVTAPLWDLAYHSR